ncbi:hypothetical protein B0H67DRAFT_680921 [Lasiosphaeris hirsuta]|uniref:Elongator complex protein 6 n=1 Tax=Lasiosphaeris hirsuta TaxID=260670 RepID=A0AA40B0T4_9PEZI|nr:hypothetical protein B0H67DRAFT_680921 [Lasiosphaeris hirsuta]
MSRAIPPLLEPYLLPSEAALLVLTNILGASTNWLVLRHLHALLKPSPTTSDSNEPPTTVVLASFLRDLPFWTAGAARLGLDLDGLARRGRLVYVDGLSGVFAPPRAPTQQQQQQQQQRAPAAAANPARWAVMSAALAEVGRVLHGAVDEAQARGGGRVVLVVDQLDFLLAATGASADGAVTGLGLRELVLDLREKTHAAILTFSADESLIGAQTTRLEKEHASFVLSLAHEAQTVISLRLLDTGTAKDVSGVMRITGGGDDSGTLVEEKEYLYHIGGDGGVRVFGRGQ